MLINEGLKILQELMDNFCKIWHDKKQQILQHLYDMTFHEKVISN